MFGTEGLAQRFILTVALSWMPFVRRTPSALGRRPAITRFAKLPVAPTGSYWLPIVSYSDSWIQTLQNMRCEWSERGPDGLSGKDCRSAHVNIRAACPVDRRCGGWPGWFSGSSHGNAPAAER